ncbi:hypothetical protein GEV33_008777 [Tenebrio molitor]|uniref:PKS/mFAS DH domain-containing protein n=1 Tax=Tenebrio molitor TaxID=7067 RepID=A0A8J6L9U9_TENMO|nr:hypothetical protein GEV33_008777 [Tenebrio molitor]
MGSQWCGMVSDLMKLPVFANTINRCHEILLPKGIDLLDIITSKDKTTFDNILHSFVGIAAIQIALTDVLKSVGIVPDGIIGHSVGELGCAYADGCMTADQMILSAYSRGRASLEATLIKGMMAATGLGYQQIKDRCPPSIEVACHNGPDSSTISGPTEDMEKFVKELQDQGTFARLVNVANIAYHSRYIKPAAPGLLKYLKEILPEPVARSAKWISTSNKEEDWETHLAKHSSAEYHTNNLLNSVLFEEGLKHIPKDSVLIEIAPHGLLQAILKRSVKSGCTNVPLTQRGYKSGVEFLLSALGKLYLAGLNMNITNLLPKLEYPVSRGTECLADLAKWEHSEVWRTGLEEKLKSLFGIRDFQVTLNSEEFRECVGHQIGDKIILPCSAYLSAIFDIVENLNTEHKEFVFENLNFKKMLTVPKVGSVPLHAMIQKGSGDFEILAGEDILVTGRLTFPNPADKCLGNFIDVEIDKNHIQLSGSDVYNEFQHRGYKYSGQYKTIKNLTIGEDGSVAITQWTNKWAPFVEAMIQQHLFQDGERGQDVFVVKNIQQIVVNQEQIPTEKKDVRVCYDFSTGVISSEGIQVVGLKAIPFGKSSKQLSFDSVELTPLTATVLPNVESGINMALQLVLENSEDKFISSVTITEIESDNPSLLENIQNVCNQYAKLNHNVVSAKDCKNISIQGSYSFLLVFNDFVTEELIKLIASSCGFLLARTSKTLLTSTEIIQIAQFSVDGVDYSIVRKSKNKSPEVVVVKGDTLSIKDLSRGSVSWVNELATAVSAAEAKKTSAYLISSLIPTEGIKNFAVELLATTKMSSLRIVFLLDKKWDINVNDPQLQQIFKRDLTLSVVKDGVLSTVIPVPLKLKNNIYSNINISSNAIQNKIVNYIGVNLRDETLLPASEKKKELGNVDYSGVTTAGQKVMGLAQLNKDFCKLEPDPILSWEVPEHWTLEEAATIPHAYTSAYYCLVEKAHLKAGETVLIHAGCSAIGLAAITIAAHYNCKIYTTVSTQWQRDFLKKQFPGLNEHNIFSSDDTSFEPLLLMATGGVGAQVIINNLSGSSLQCSVGCLAEYGRFLQIGKYDVEESNSIGMSVFLKNTSFYVVSLENVCTESKETKEHLRALLREGVENGAVRPLYRKVLEHQDILQILNTLSNSGSIGKILIKINNNNISLNKFILNNPSQFICDSKSSYLIYGGSADLWIDTVEWLIFRGARKVIISSDSKPQQLYINRRISLLKSYFGADIVYVPPKAHTREGAAELLSEVYLLGPIHLVFLLPSKNNGSRMSEVKSVQYIEHALRATAPKAVLVNFNKNAAGICELHSEASFLTYNVQWQKDLEFTEALSGVDEILSCKAKNIWLRDDGISDSDKETAQSLSKKLTHILPTSLEDFTEETSSAPAKPELVQLVTLGPREMRELSPVFIIPGLSGDKELKEMALQLLYPTFCAVLPSTPLSIKELALDLVEKITKVWPKGAYNIIGISWGGALMLEIAKILDKQGASLHLYFLDAAPDTLQAAVKLLGEDLFEMETTLLTRILNINDSEIVNKMGEVPTWESRVKLALDNYEGHLSDKKKLGDGLSTLKMRLQDILSFKPTEDLVSGQIHLIRPTGSSKYDNCGLLSWASLKEGLAGVELRKQSRQNIIAAFIYLPSRFLCKEEWTKFSAWSAVRMLAGAVLPTSSADIFPNFTIKNYIAMTIFIASLSASSPDPYFDRSDQIAQSYLLHPLTALFVSWNTWRRFSSTIDSVDFYEVSCARLKSCVVLRFVMDLTSTNMNLSWESSLSFSFSVSRPVELDQRPERTRVDLSPLPEPAAASKDGDNLHLDANKMEALFRRLRPLLVPGEAKGRRVSSPGAGPVRQDEKEKVDVRSFFWDDEKSKKSVSPRIRKLRLRWGSQKKTLLLSFPSHGSFTKKEERDRNENLSLTPKKSTQSRRRKMDLNGCRQKENREPTGVPGDEESRQWMKQVGLSDPLRKEKNVEGREGEWDLSSWSPKGKRKGPRRSLTNLTVCNYNYHLAEIARIKTPFQPPDRLGSNVKNEEKPTRKTQREGKVERRITDNDKRTGR